MFRNKTTTKISSLLEVEFPKLEQRVMDLEHKVKELESENEYYRKQYAEQYQALREYLDSSSDTVGSYDCSYSHYPLANWSSCKRSLERVQTYDEVKEIALKWVEETAVYLKGLHEVFENQRKAIREFMYRLGMFDR